MQDPNIYFTEATNFVRAQPIPPSITPYTQPPSLIPQGTLTNIATPANIEVTEAQAKSRYKFRYAFSQQLLQAWRPRFTLKCAIMTYSAIGIIFFAFGIIILALANQISLVNLRYDHVGPVSATVPISIIFNIESDMSAPIYLFYQIKGFFQNHRDYVLSQSFSQLRGEEVKPEDIEYCKPVIYNANLSDWQKALVKNFDPNAVAIPCGAVASTYFNDTFELSSSDGTIYTFSDKDISWSNEKELKFKNIDLNRQWIDMEGERFINWMKIAPFDGFRKTWGVLHQNLPKGVYTMRINNYWDVSVYEGEKWFILSEINAFGGRNEFLGYIYIGVGFLSVILAMIFSMRTIKRPKGFTEFHASKIDPPQ